ncbi:MAG: hypothetical protein H0U70_02560 [Tatlockia sp.]|nr:hypothetical protein [Tatlockia sp.]
MLTAQPLNLIKKLLECGASLEVQTKKGQTPIEIAHEHSTDGRVIASDKLLAAFQQGLQAPTPSELKQSLKQIFQMNPHQASEVVSLPISKREYSKCGEGTLYIPKGVVEKLHEVIQCAKGNIVLLSAFESEFNILISSLEKGHGTGIVMGNEDEFVPKCFKDAKNQLEPVMNTLIKMKHEVTASKFINTPEFGLSSLKVG